MLRIDCSAGFPTGGRSEYEWLAGLEARDTADLEVGATVLWAGMI
ncbi:MAG TPA: hypothetical protein VMH30_00445 [Verrucomicrobiae bacterium]|nr:hypothetical protein [Verrucomicrobiae bacterium]